MLYNKDWAYKLNPVADVLFNAADPAGEAWPHQA